MDFKTATIAEGVNVGGYHKYTEGIFDTSTTYPTEEAIAEVFGNSRAVHALNFLLSEHGTNVKLVSAPGIGKTGFSKDYLASFGLNVMVIHAPTLDPDRLAVSVPVPVGSGEETRMELISMGEASEAADGKTVVLTPLLSRLLKNADIILLDEPRRAKDRTRKAIMEMLTEKSLGGQPLKPGVKFLLLDNNLDLGGITDSGTELARETRYVTFDLQSRDIPWKVALASTFRKHDLTELFRVYDNLEARFPGSSRYVSPRVLEHIIWCVVNGLPASYGVPLNDNGIDHIRSHEDGAATAGRVVTNEVLDSFCQALGLPRLEPSPAMFQRAVKLVVEQNKSMMLMGAPGVGKSSYIISEVKKIVGDDYLYWSMQNVSPDEHVVPFPRNGELEIMLSDQLSPLHGRPITHIRDEAWRAKPATLNMVMEMDQSDTCGGQKLNVRGKISITNPAKVGDHRLEVGRPDRAQAERYFVSVTLGQDDIPAGEYLRTVYGEIAEPFVDWRENDLELAEQLYIPYRVLENMIKLYKGFGNTDVLRAALPRIGDTPVSVALNRLIERIRRVDIFDIATLRENSEELSERLLALAPETGLPADPGLHLQVASIFQTASPASLAVTDENGQYINYDGQVVESAADAAPAEWVSTIFLALERLQRQPLVVSRSGNVGTSKMMRSILLKNIEKVRERDAVVAEAQAAARGEA